MKKYYSPTKEYFTRKRLRLGYRFMRAVAKLFFPKNEIVFTGEKPSDDEPRFLVSNHTKIYAPVYYLTEYPRPIRLWANCYFLSIKEIGRHLFKKVLPSQKHKFLLYPAAVLLMPLIVALFKSLQPIPAYHFDKRVKDTVKKSIETFEEGVDQIIFPERTENPVNDYVYEFNKGFTHVAKEYYDKTGKIMKFYPVYTCQSLRKIMVGNPISYNPDIPMRLQKQEITDYLENAIKELGDGLPEHKIVFYG